MSKLLAHVVRQAYTIVLIPLFVGFLVAGLFWIFSGGHAAVSALLGVAVWVIPQLYFVTKLFGKALQKNANGMLWVFYRAEMIKFLLSAILFVMVIKYLTVVSTIVLLTFIAAQITFLLTALIILGLKVS